MVHLGQSYRGPEVLKRVTDKRDLGGRHAEEERGGTRPR